MRRAHGQTCRPWLGAPRAGFTLVEVLSSVLLLVLAILGTSALTANGIQGMRMLGWDTMARAAVIGELERYKAMTNAQLFNPADPAYVADGTYTFTTSLDQSLQDVGAVGKTYVSSEDWDADAQPDDARKISVVMMSRGACPFS